MHLVCTLLKGESDPFLEIIDYRESREFEDSGDASSETTPFVIISSNLIRPCEERAEELWAIPLSVIGSASIYWGVRSGVLPELRGHQDAPLPRLGREISPCRFGEQFVANVLFGFLSGTKRKGCFNPNIWG